MWASFVRRPALIWTEQVSYRIGSWIAAFAFDTAISPNGLTIAGLVVHALGAVLVVALPASWPAIIATLLVWQAAFGLDCADGMLARSRGQTSAFGAWLDQVVDFASHVLVFGALAQVVIATQGFSAAWAAPFAIFVVAGNSILGYAVGVKGAASVEGRNLTTGRTVPATAARVILNITDYGLVLFIASVLLASPSVLAGYLVLNAALSIVAVVAQLAVYGRNRKGA